MALYNTAVTVIQVIEAASETAAVATLKNIVTEAGLTVYDGTTLSGDPACNAFLVD